MADQLYLRTLRQEPLPVELRAVLGKVVGDLGVEVMPAEVAGSGPNTPASTDLSRPNPDDLRNAVRNALLLWPPLQTVPHMDSEEEPYVHRVVQKRILLTRGPVRGMCGRCDFSSPCAEVGIGLSAPSRSLCFWSSRATDRGLLSGKKSPGTASVLP